MHESRDRATMLQDPDLRDLLCRSVPDDSVLEADEGAQLSILDVDTHHWPEKPADELLHATVSSGHPRPDAHWVSHGKGLKLVFVGPFHRQRCLAAAFSIPTSFHVELLRTTRHPRSRSSKHPGAACGPVAFEDNHGGETFRFKLVGPVSPEQQAEVLQHRDMTMGGRYDHDRCPIEPDAASDAKGCVVVNGKGIYCHRCAGHGACYSGMKTPGFVPYLALVSEPRSVLDNLAASWVHWTHARLDLRHHFPHIGESLLREAYRETLRARWHTGDATGPSNTASTEGPREEDRRIQAVFDAHLDFVLGENGWLDARTYKPTQIENDAADSLPHVQNRNGSVNKARRAQVKYRTPQGYSPVCPYRGILLRSGTGIPVQQPPSPRYPIALLDQPLTLEETLAGIQAAFPKIDPRYLQAALAAGICAEVGEGQPPMLVVTGPSGSGKGETLRLAASILGDAPIKLQLGEDPQKLMRQIGSACAEGCRFLNFDEVGKVEKLYNKLHAILQISTFVSWTPHYKNGSATTPCRSAFFYTCVRFPDSLIESPEFNRRAYHVPLSYRVGDWQQTCGGDTASWRDRAPQNAKVANSLLTHVWESCRKHGFVFHGPCGVAKTLQLGRLSDRGRSSDPMVLKLLYRHARNEDGQRKLIEGSLTFVRGWLDAKHKSTMALLAPFLPLDEHDGNPKAAFFAMRRNLESVSWNDDLGIDQPGIECEVGIHGAQVGLRFRSAEPCLKGREKINEELPPLPFEEAPAPVSDTISRPPAPTKGAEAAVFDILQNVFQKGSAK